MKGLPEDLADLDEANTRFRQEVRRFRFCYRCEACAHLDVPTNLCSLGYPNHTLVGEIRVISADGNLTFCKYFELGEGASAH